MDGKFRYRPLLDQRPLDPNSSVIFGSSHFNSQMRLAWETINRQPSFVPCGEVLLTEFVGFGTRSLLIDFQHAVGLVGGVVNWGKDHARWIFARHAQQDLNISWTGIEDVFEITVDPSTIVPEPKPGILMSSPGQDIYGHWLLDYVPRLMLTELMDSKWKEIYYFNEIKSWAHFFLEAFRIPASSIRILPQRQLTYFPSLAMPSGAKQDFRLSEPLNTMAWKKLKAFAERSYEVLPPTDEPEFGSRIFISRREWGSSQRTIANSARLEEIAVARGYKVFLPEQFSIPVQARVMRRARIIVGEDGSGLHNIIFSEPGAVLGVISVPDRINLWHVGICRGMGHHLSCIGSDVSEDGARVVNQTAYTAFLDELEGMASL